MSSTSVAAPFSRRFQIYICSRNYETRMIPELRVSHGIVTLEHFYLACAGSPGPTCGTTAAWGASRETSRQHHCHVQVGLFGADRGPAHLQQGEFICNLACDNDCRPQEGNSEALNSCAGHLISKKSGNASCHVAVLLDPDSSFFTN